MVNYNKLAFYSQHPIDKIVGSGSISIVNDGDTGTDWYWSKVVTVSKPHTYGRLPFVRARWSIDGGENWQSLESHLVYTFLLNSESGDTGHPYTDAYWNLDSAISIGADENNVYFRTANGRHGTVTGFNTPTYTPTSRTFDIEYWLYERE